MGKLFRSLWDSTRHDLLTNWEPWLCLPARLLGTGVLSIVLERGEHLLSGDANGLSDPFVTVEWDGREQSTRVVPKDLNPKWNQVGRRHE